MSTITDRREMEVLCLVCRNPKETISVEIKTVIKLPDDVIDEDIMIMLPKLYHKKCKK